MSPREGMAGQARQRRRFDTLALDVADDQRDAILDTDGVVEVAAHVVCTRGRQVTAGELQSRHGSSASGSRLRSSVPNTWERPTDFHRRGQRTPAPVRRFVEQRLVLRVEVRTADAEPPHRPVIAVEGEAKTPAG